MLNKGQQKAVDSKSDKILCLAGAGTGKTYTMLSRISNLVNEQNINPHNILVLTFTNAAAFEMEERYKMQNQRKLVPSFSTFHAFCYRLIANDAEIMKLIGYTEVPDMPDDSALKQIDTKVRQQCGIKLSQEKIAGKKALTMKEQFEYDIYWKKFKKLLKERNLITFDIMCYEVCALFADDNPAVQQYKERFKYIFVDEFQDTDPKQWDFICSFKDVYTFVVGDVQQAIYGFRGADSSIIKSLAENREWETIRLIENYRSTIQICDFANKINIDAYDFYRLDLESKRNGEDVYEIDDSPHLINNKAWTILLGEITSLAKGSTAILARTNAEVKTMKYALDNMKIKYNSVSVEGEWLEGILKSVMDDEYAVGWLASKLSAFKFTEWVKLCAIDGSHKTFEGFRLLYDNQYGVFEHIQRIVFIRNKFNDDSLLPMQKYEAVLKHLGIKISIPELIPQNNEDIINAIIQFSDNSEESNIYVGTIHSVKGLEYDEVHVIGVGGDSFQISGEEMRNLYYVACTRAKNELNIHWYNNAFRGN
jgi:DNA helicase-2/ATP-dependent DNA helicase PcrA